MSAIRRSLRGAIVRAALGAALIAWVIAAIAIIIGTQRLEHGTLDAASAAVRDVVGTTSDPRVLATELERLEPSFATWGVVAAAFDRAGNLIAGDTRLRADGLAPGRTPAAPSVRQLAFVDTGDGYVLLAPDPVSIGRLRASLIAAALATFVLVAGLAWLFGGRWARARANAAEQLSAGLATHVALSHDPLYGALSREVAETVARLRSAVAERTDGEDRLRLFLAEAAHELRTPLAIAIGYVGILERGALSDPELAARIVRDVAVEQTRLTRLVERILLLARLDALPAQSDAATDVRTTIDEALTLVRPLDPARVTAVHGNADQRVALSSDDLRDALRNVLENAIRYAPGAPVRIAVRREGEAVEVEIADTGPGMDAFAAAHAFDRFFRGAERGDVPGAGLGLAIVKRIVERAGGTVALVSAPGEGTAITFRLPAATAAV